MASQFDRFLTRKLEDPAFKDAYEDARERHELQKQLTELRRSSALSQTEVGSRMGVGQSMVSELEREMDGDPRLSTLQRYARAVGARLCWGLEDRATAAHMGMFVSSSGSVDFQYRATSIRWLGEAGEPVPWPSSKRRHFARAS